MRKSDGRKKSDAQKAATKAARLDRAAAKRRVEYWKTAATVAAEAGHPLNAAVHLTWSALKHGDRREGHVLGRPDAEKCVWSALRLVAARADVPWLAARGPEYDRKRAGLHLHVVSHLPDTPAIRDAINVVERLTGAPAEWIDTKGRTVRSVGNRRHHGVVAMSACRGWMIQRNVPELGGDGIGVMRYAGKGDGKAQVEGQHRLSNELSGLVRQHRAAQRGAVGDSSGHLAA